MSKHKRKNKGRGRTTQKEHFEDDPYQNLKEMREVVSLISEGLYEARECNKKAVKAYLMGLDSDSYRLIRGLLLESEIEMVGEEREKLEKLEVEKESKTLWKEILAMEADLVNGVKGKITRDRHIGTKYTFGDSLSSAILTSIHNDFRGDKIVSINIKDSQGKRKFGSFFISNEIIGNNMSEMKMFFAFLEALITTGGVLTLRHFLPIKVQRKVPSGELLWIPRKDIYALRIESGRILQVSAKTNRECNLVDANTGKYIGPEPDVAYKAWPSLSVPFDSVI